MKKEMKRNIFAIVSVLIISIAIIMVSKSIFPDGFIEDRYGKGAEFYNGVITEIIEEDLNKDPILDGVEIGYQKVVAKVTEGQYKDNTYEIKNNISRLYNYKVEEGTKVVLILYKQNNGNMIWDVYGYDRSSMIYVLAGIFIIVVIIIGGVKGIKSLVSLMFTLVTVIFLMLPLMFRGVEPMLAAVVSATLSIIVTLSLVSGINKKTVTAIIGTISGVVISGIIAYIFGELTHSSGMTMNDTESLIYIAEGTNLKVKGIMFAGILIASLGAVMDVAMSISSSLFEIYEVNKNIKQIDLFKSSMNIGKDIIGTMTNTLILAFAGGSITTLILIFAANMPYNKFINLEVLAIEIIQGLAGSIGIVLSVPITAVVGSYLCRKKMS
ncbi:MAG: YibE/F family protein [Clostridium sp.]|uniref:YibE/F family protein n=1 Tax=Clostridium sp. TaxID=1506 RepID=UPI002670FF08|nr:YibE/F family protein [Clostridium sp.]MDD7682942.1 YibE/F family protein [Clostridium sp.]MDY2579662.1 YibE/F family protein [Clostridium sp.]